MRRRSPRRGGRPAHARGAPGQTAPTGSGQTAPAAPGQTAPAAEAPLAAAPAWRAALERSVARGGGGLMAIALLMGAGAGAGAIAFRYMILGVTYLFTGHDDYSSAGRAGNPLLGLGGWFVIAAPVVGGLIYGPLITASLRRPAGTGCPR